MKLLMHACCAPCSVMCIDTLRKEGIEPTLFWYNPNIHPFREYQKRKRTLIDYADSACCRLIIINEYGLRKFIDEIYPDYDDRCAKCYDMRLNRTASFARENGFDAFTSTLFISPYQRHSLMKDIAEGAAERHGVQFLYRDFREYFEEGQERAKELGLYRQGFCGCIFSEEESYSKKRKKELYRKRMETNKEPEQI